MATKAVKERGICIRVACQAFRIGESCYRYERKPDAEIEEIATWLIKLTDNNHNWALAFAVYICATLRVLNGTARVFTGST
jgi:putative transposase